MNFEQITKHNMKPDENHGAKENCALQDEVSDHAETGATWFLLPYSEVVLAVSISATPALDPVLDKIPYAS